MKNVIKTHCLIFFVFFSFTSFSQVEYYQLVKNGEKYPKPIYYLKDDSLERIVKTDSSLIFLFKYNSFIHNINNHTSSYVLNENIKAFNVVNSPEQLYTYEEEEFDRRAKEYENKTNFKPIPPIKHTVLKIYILNEDKKEGKICAYEVDWK